MRAKSILSLILLSIAPSGWACPPALSSAAIEELKQSGSEDLSEYALARLFKCGWQEAKPVFSEALDAAHAEGDDADSRVIYLFAMNPRSVAAGFAEEVYEDQPLLAPLAISSKEVEPAVQRFEDALPELAALVREKLSLEQDADAMLELALASRDLRLGNLDEARLRLDRVQQNSPHTGSDAESADDMHEAISEMRAAMDDSSPSDAGSSQPAWIIDRTTTAGPRRFKCGGPIGLPLMDSTSIKAQAQLVRKDVDGAIGTLLQARWRALASKKSDSVPDLMHLLEQRYSHSEMRQAWADAEASIRIEPNFAGFSLFGQFLLLPIAVREDDTASSSPNAYKERLLTQDEALALMRGSALHEAIFDDK